MDFKKDCRSNDWRVRCNVASNLNCPIHIMEILSRDEDYWVRSNVAGNPNCSEEIKVAFVLEN